MVTTNIMKMVSPLSFFTWQARAGAVRSVCQTNSSATITWMEFAGAHQPQARSVNQLYEPADKFAPFPRVVRATRLTQDYFYLVFARVCSQLTLRATLWCWAWCCQHFQGGNKKPFSPQFSSCWSLVEPFILMTYLKA